MRDRERGRKETKVTRKEDDNTAEETKRTSGGRKEEGKEGTERVQRESMKEKRCIKKTVTKRKQDKVSRKKKRRVTWYTR